MTWPRSLALRLALAAGLWVAGGLGAVAWLVTDIAVRQIEATFDARLSGLLDAAVAAAVTDAEGRVVVARAPAGADFERPFSGAYWQITAPDGSLATSRSLWDQTLPAATSGREGVVLRDVSGPRDEMLRVAERDLLLPGATGTAHVAVALSRTEVEAEIHRLRALLLLTFSLLGMGLVAGVVAMVVAGLAPLRRVSQALAEIRDGRREQLAIEAPSEIAPLVVQLDELIAANRVTVERARSHVGNLAHAVKTPLAVLRNALDQYRPDIETARAEASGLERLVQHHLARARTSALAKANAGMSVAPFVIAEEIANALRRIFVDRGVSIVVEGERGVYVRVDPQDLTEMLGNLMENACKWAHGKVLVSVLATDSKVLVTIIDDGPGLPKAERDAVIGRGVRLDERKPGSGLGLGIAAELAALHNGKLEISVAPSGGVAATLHLQRAASNAPT
ncbi:MAG: HAMP domain-containing histidine kinase [Roseomonas sp.]|nr:HAMP domain-containing histidine kinase [Roseomonas sp.]MCA3343416.1 HAMP domain-containing histidine kinase [Roseomonas sp.]